MKKTLIITLVLAFAIPHIAFAVWWNPFTWKIFNRTKAPEKTVELPALKNTVDCNGTNYTACPAGQRFVCPAVGSGECVIEAPTSAQTSPLPQSVVSPTLPPPSGDQMKRVLWMCGVSQELKDNCDKLLPYYSTNETVRKLLDDVTDKVEAEYYKRQ